MVTMFITSVALGQTVSLKGEIKAHGDVEGIHIVNRASGTYTTSNSNGEFSINAKLQDTILFTGVSYQPEKVVVDKAIIQLKSITVVLKAHVNVLDEVVVGKILTGDLKSDIANSDIDYSINFYDLGIPGYTGEPLTQTERRLYEATSGDGIVPLAPIINAITGRTKMLKAHVIFERLDKCLNHMKSKFSSLLFSDVDLSPSVKSQFYYFCQEDPEFEQLCKSPNDMAVFEFLKAKLKVFLERQDTNKE